MGYSFRLTARVLLYAPSHRQDNTYHGLCYTSCGALAGTRNSSMGPPHEGSIRRPTAPWANALPLSYVLLHQSGMESSNWQRWNVTCRRLSEFHWNDSCHWQLWHCLSLSSDQPGVNAVFGNALHWLLSLEHLSCDDHSPAGTWLSMLALQPLTEDDEVWKVTKIFNGYNHHWRLIWRKEGNVLFNDTLNTFYLRLYGVGHMVKDHSVREETRCRHMGYSSD